MTREQITGVVLALMLSGVSPAHGDDVGEPEAWGVRAYDAAVLLEVTGFPDCLEDARSCRARRWSLTAPAMRTSEATVLVAAPAGALSGALRVTLRLPGEVAPRGVVQIPIPLRLGVAVLAVEGTASPSIIERLPPVPVGPEGRLDDLLPSVAGERVVWILSRSPQDPTAPPQPLHGRLVSPDPGPGTSPAPGLIGVDLQGAVHQGGGFVCDDQGAFLGLLERVGDGWVLVPEHRVRGALAVAVGAVKSGTVDTTPGESPAFGVLSALEAFTSYQATGATDGPGADIVVDGEGTTLEPAAQRLLETAYCRSQQAWRSLVDARANQNTDHVELLSEYWEWIQSSFFRQLQGCLAQETGTTVLLSCFACYPSSPHRASRPSPSPLFTGDLYFRLVACDEAGLRRFCTECLLYERYEDLLIHSGLEDERLRLLLPFVRRIDSEVFKHRLEPTCEKERP